MPVKEISATDAARGLRRVPQTDPEWSDELSGRRRDASVQELAQLMLDAAALVAPERSRKNFNTSLGDDDIVIARRRRAGIRDR